MRVDVDERFERQARKLLLDAVGVGVREERVERLRIGGDREAHARGRRGRDRIGARACRCREHERDGEAPENGDHLAAHPGMRFQPADQRVCPDGQNEDQNQRRVHLRDAEVVVFVDRQEADTAIGKLDLAEQNADDRQIPALTACR